MIYIIAVFLVFVCSSLVINLLILILIVIYLLDVLTRFARGLVLIRHVGYKL